jgi:hypothetical protein
VEKRAIAYVAYIYAFKKAHYLEAMNIVVLLPRS